MALPLHREHCPDQTSTKLLRALKAEAEGPLLDAVPALQEYASRRRLVPSQSHTYQSIYDQPITGTWALTSYARLEVVEEEIETDNGVVQPETSSNVPDSEVTSHVPSVSEDKHGNATGTEGGESTEGARGQDKKPLDMVPLNDTDDYTIPLTPSVSPTPKPTEMPMSGPSSEDSNLEPWIQGFSDLQISESPPPLAGTFSSSSRGDGPSRYGWSHSISPPSPTGVHWNVSSEAPARFHSLPYSFDRPAPAFPTPGPAMPSFPVSVQAVPSPQDHHFDLVEPSFPIPQPTVSSFAVPSPADLPFPALERPVPSFPIHDPTNYLGEINEHVNSPTSYFHGSHATHSNSPLFPTRPSSSQSTQQLYQPPSSSRRGPPPNSPPSPPPPPHYGSLGGVVPSSPPRLSRFEKETAAIRHQFQEAMRTTWSGADQEKVIQSVKQRTEQKTVALRNGNDTFADAGWESIQWPKGED